MERKIVFTKLDLAKYPFLEEASKYVGRLGFDIRDLEMMSPVLDRAEDRLKSALLGIRKEKSEILIEEVEIFSFPVAVIMAVATENQIVKRRFADYEAKRIVEYLKEEGSGKIIEIARRFGWRIKFLEEKKNYGFVLHFVDYLKNAINFNESKWKLVNRTLVKGNVLLTKSDVVRLIEEEVRRYIENKLNMDLDMKLPETLVKRIDELRELISKEKAKFKLEEFPSEIINEAFPPCIKRLYDNVLAGRRVSHMGRFTLTAFLLNVGFKPEEVIKLFSSASDFNERLTRYQVEHIAGSRGSRTKYISPKCSTLKTHRLCIDEGRICGRVKHPLTYYRRMVWRLQKKKGV